jgi:hypothetical protein
MSQVSTVAVRADAAQAGRSSRSAGAAYDGGPGTVGAARRFTTSFLAGADGEGCLVSPRVADDVCLIVSELVTNAAKYAPGPCLLDLELTEDAVRVTLWDTEPVAPVPRGADAHRIGQHGMEIVLALCRRFEVERQSGGKRIQVDVPRQP